MPPQQSPTPSNLDFILRAEQPKPSRFGGGNSKTQRIMAVAVIGVVLVILAFVLLSIVKRSNSSGSSALVDLAAYQTELARIIDIGIKSSPDSGVQGIAQTGSLTLVSDLIRTRKMIDSKNVRLSKNDLIRYETKSIDADLDTAKTANNFDAVFTKLVDEKLDDYKRKLASVYAAQNDTNIRNALRSFNANAELLPFSYSP